MSPTSPKAEILEGVGVTRYSNEEAKSKAFFCPTFHVERGVREKEKTAMSGNLVAT